MDHTGATAPKLKWGGLREDRGKEPVPKTDDPAFLKAAAPPAGCYVWSLLIFDEPNNLRITVYGPGQPGATNMEKVHVFEGAGGGKIISALEAKPEGGMNMILSHIPNGPQLTVPVSPSDGVQYVTCGKSVQHQVPHHGGCARQSHQGGAQAGGAVLLDGGRRQRGLGCCASAGAAVRRHGRRCQRTTVSTLHVVFEWSPLGSISCRRACFVNGFYYDEAKNARRY